MRALRALALVLALSVCAYAGNMGNGAIDPPPTPPSQSIAPETAGESAPTDSMTEMTLDLLASLLSLLYWGDKLWDSVRNAGFKLTAQG